MPSLTMTSIAAFPSSSDNNMIYHAQFLWQQIHIYSDRPNSTVVHMEFSGNVSDNVGT